MTSDGITDADWDRVHTLAVDIVNCSAAGDDSGETRARASLMAVLDELDERYGLKPSLLATRADYVQSPADRQRLLHAAYTAAEQLADSKNCELIAHSLTEFYLEEVADLDEGAMWLAVWRNALGITPTASDLYELARLEAALIRGPRTEGRE